MPVAANLCLKAVYITTIVVLYQFTPTLVFLKRFILFEAYYEHQSIGNDTIDHVH